MDLEDKNTETKCDQDESKKEFISNREETCSDEKQGFQTVAEKENIVKQSEKSNENSNNNDQKSNKQTDNDLGSQGNVKNLFPESDTSVVLSNNNVFPPSNDIVSSNCSLDNLKCSSSDCAALTYREDKSQNDESESGSDTSSSSSSTSVATISDSSTESESEEEIDVRPARRTQIKAKGEMDLNDLPPIEDLTITVPEEDCIPIGKVFQIVDQLVVVQSKKDVPALDLDSVLFLKGGQPLGKVFDVLGPVQEPYYCVRFNSKEHIQEKNITLGQIVCCVPKKKEYTNYVFLAQLMKLKGSDASWEHDLEPPEVFLDFSDDEQEQMARKARRGKAVMETTIDLTEPTRKRHFAYEKRMNRRNLQVSAAMRTQNNIQSYNKTPWTSPISRPSLSSSSRTDRCDSLQRHMFGRPPLFNPRVPPPSLPGRFQSNNLQNLTPTCSFARPRVSSWNPQPVGQFPKNNNGGPFSFRPTPVYDNIRSPPLFHQPSTASIDRNQSPLNAPQFLTTGNLPGSSFSSPPPHFWPSAMAAFPPNHRNFRTNTPPPPQFPTSSFGPFPNTVSMNFNPHTPPPPPPFQYK